jgi:hypothetical protein
MVDAANRLQGKALHLRGRAGCIRLQGGFFRVFWTSKGIFAQRWGAKMVVTAVPFDRFLILPADGAAECRRADRDKDLKRMG